MNNLNHYSSLQRQYQGFLQTPQLNLKHKDFKYPSFSLANYPEQLPESFEMPKPIRMGQRMEVFMEVALQQECRIVAKNLQILAEKQTLGELDFILESLATKRLIHLEMAYKFYLFRPEAPGNWMDQLYGPNAKDQLSLKLDKMQQHQFPVLYRPETRKYIIDLDLDIYKIQQQSLLKVQLYLPFKSFKASVELQHKASGFYYQKDDLIALKDPSNMFGIPLKNNWVASPNSHEGFEAFEVFYSKVQALLKERRSSLFWVYNTELKEYSRHFASWW